MSSSREAISPYHHLFGLDDEDSTFVALEELIERSLADEPPPASTSRQAPVQGRRRFRMRRPQASATEDDDNAEPWTPVPDCTAFPHDHIVPGASERFKCSICLQVMEEPVSIFPCGHSFNEACIKKHMASRPSAKCPKGCDTVIDRWVKLPDMREIIRESVSARCIHDGCESVMTIDELPAHANACAHRRFRCSLRGSDGGVCGAEATRTEQQSHENTCPHVMVQCGHEVCRKRTRRAALGDHMMTCEWRPVVCKCGVTHPFRNSVGHKKLCLDEAEPCPIRSAL